ncbi:MAG: hypothetical protein N3J91_04820 [Verrucomicrobiae bacterium]|nr:hypothetical protein [Verrucomicrobiae bacterium]
MNKWPKLFLVGVGGAVLSVVGFNLLPVRNDHLPSGTPLAEISRVAATEIPAVAASLVRQAPAESRTVVARQVLEAVQALERPCALPYVVAEMTKAEPAVAPQAVATAAELQPAESLAAVQAAVAAAPQLTGDILFEFSQKMPGLSFAAAQAAATVAADQALVAVRAVGRALPGFAPHVERAVQNQASAGKIDVTTVLKQAQEMAAVAAQEEKRKEAERAVTTAMAQQPVASPVRTLPDGKVELQNLGNYAASELARANQSTAKPAQPSLAVASASAAFKAPAKAVSPASLKVPSPEQVKSQVDDLVRPNNYNRP